MTIGNEFNEESQILISIVMPTLNEEKRIERGLKSIREQSINSMGIEILVIDGGSTDKTREISEKYGARILDNPKVVPEEAVTIGLQNSVGKYIVFMGADEVFTDMIQMEKRINLLKNNSDVKVVLTNCYKTPDDYPGITRYVNSLGDPFSYFIYGFDSENFIGSLDKKKFAYKKNEDDGRVYYLKKDDFSPIGDGATITFDFDYLKEYFIDRFGDPAFVATKFDEVINKTGCFGVVEGDTIDHYTTSSVNVYLKKLKFRVINNLYPEDNISGYTERAQTNKRLNARKYLYLLYCLIPPIVLFDAVIKTIRKKCFAFMLHFIFVYYVIFQVFIIGLIKISGKKVYVKNYGK